MMIIMNLYLLFEFVINRLTNSEYKFIIFIRVHKRESQARRAQCHLVTSSNKEISSISLHLL